MIRDESPAASLPAELRPPCPRGCVDVEGCGCEWNQRREAWPNEPLAANDREKREVDALMESMQRQLVEDAGRYAAKTSTWVPTGNKVLIPCVNCGGEYEELRVEPDRSPAYLRQIFLCKSCKGIFGFPKQPSISQNVH